jgi:cytochrome c553
MKRFLLLAFSIVLASGAGHAGSPDLDKTIANCAMCHGKDGNSPSAKVPRLNGQTAAYLASRLKSFRDPTRQSPHATYVMWDVSGNTADARISALAEFFSRGAPTPLPQASSTRAAEGKRIYQNGAGGIGACSACHGANGEGAGTVPRLAGQHGAYLSEALNDFGTQARVHDQMRVHAGTLSTAQIQALTAYLAHD